MSSQAAAPVTNEQILAAIRSLAGQVQILNQKADILMTQQDNLDAQVAQLQQIASDLAAADQAGTDAVNQLTAEIAALRAQNPAMDLSGLDTAVQAVQAASDRNTRVVQSVSGLATANQPQQPPGPASAASG